MIKDIDDNFYLHSWKIPAQTSGMKVVHLDHLTYVDSGLSCDTFNIIHVRDGAALQESEIDRAIEHFRSRNLEYCIWLNSQNLSDGVKKIFDIEAVKKQNEEAGMVLQLDSYDPKKDELHSNIRIVGSNDELNDYAQVIARNWNPADQNVLTYFERTRDKYLNSKNGIMLLVYYHEGDPVSTVEMFPSDVETIGLYGFATLSSHRGLGIGTSLMTFALNKSKEIGYKRAILQASDDGIGIYRKFGFKELTTYFEYA